MTEAFPGVFFATLLFILRLSVKKFAEQKSVLHHGDRMFRNPMFHMVDHEDDVTL
jgi:hypothetical protein